jgi:hypothetical protein
MATKQAPFESLDSKKHGYFGGTKWFFTDKTIATTYEKVNFAWIGMATSTGDYQQRSKRIMLKAPTTNTGDVTFSFNCVDAPDAPTADATATAGNPNGIYTYKVTFVTAEGESLPSAATSAITVSSKKITVTIPVNTDPSRIVTQRKIYRTATGPGATHLLLTTVSDNTTTTYLDDKADGDLGAAAPATNTTGQSCGTVSKGDMPAFDGASFRSIYVKGTAADTMKIWAWG